MRISFTDIRVKFGQASAIIAKCDNSRRFIAPTQFLDSGLTDRYGEQWVFTFDHKTSVATLRGGDVGWNSEYCVVDGKVASLILGKDEQLWLSACWIASQR